ncbi:MAG TPA: beta-propeller domain-containing protein [Allosphingosinicella sp.]|jgi:hypothetical protein
MSLLRIAAAALALAAWGPAGAQSRPDPQARAAAAAALERFTSPTLTRFADEAEFEAYLAAVRNYRRRAELERGGPIRFAEAQPPGADQPPVPAVPVCPPERPDCPAGRRDDTITVTGTLATASNASITNNQMRGVEEGDIVKQIGRFLLVLSDGRIFVIDTMSRGRRALALADRVDVYRDPESTTWYDEMLVFGDRILITGYSYREDSSELSVFRLDSEGRLSREGVFYISSDDYYDPENYATRLVGDRLVVYTPVRVQRVAAGGFAYPIVRRWIPGEVREEAERRGRRLFDARSIYRPVRLDTNPTIHTVSVCPLGEVGAGRDLECRSTAFAGPRDAEWYVTANEAFLWTSAGNEFWYRADRDLGMCGPGPAPPLDGVLEATVYRVPHGEGAAPQVLGARGVPFDQFSLQADDGRLRALVDRLPTDCEREYYAAAEPVYFDAPLTAFGERIAEVPHERYTSVPSPGSQWIANRFTERYLVYGGLSRFRSGPPDVDNEDYYPAYRRRLRQELAIPPAYAVPADRPQDVHRLAVGHSVIRVERAGENIVLTGYRDRRGLSVSLIDLRARPRVASTLRLDGRYETEGRSHAFNSLIAADGSGTIGLPTSPRAEEGGRWWWRSRASDVSFFAVDRHGALDDLGMLRSSVIYEHRGDDEADGLDDYVCEVSCVDWYGNSRPIFTDGRVFALTGVELVEGRVIGFGIREVRRLDFARARPRHRRR